MTITRLVVDLEKLKTAITLLREAFEGLTPGERVGVDNFLHERLGFCRMCGEPDPEFDCDCCFEDEKIWKQRDDEGEELAKELWKWDAEQASLDNPDPEEGGQEGG